MNLNSFFPPGETYTKCRYFVSYSVSIVITYFGHAVFLLKREIMGSISSESLGLEKYLGVTFKVDIFVSFQSYDNDYF